MSTEDPKEKERKALFLRLYQEAFPSIAAYIHRRGGTFEMAKDLFQDALLIYHENGYPSTEKGPKAYLFGIVRHLWYQQHGAMQREDRLVQGLLTELPLLQEPKPSEKRVLDFIVQAGQKCMDMLKAFYYDGDPMKTIAARFGFRGERSATVQKYKCLEKIRAQVKSKKMHYEDFID